MQVNIRQMKIKNCSDYLQIKNIQVYYIKYIPTKSTDREWVYNDDDKDILYLFFDDVDGYIEENNGIKYLVFTSTERNKKTLKNYRKPWEETKRQIEVINYDELIEYGKDFMEIKFESDDDFPLGKTFNILDMIVVAASVLEKNGIYCPKMFLHECVYKL